MANFDEMAHFLTLLEAHGARRAKGARTISDARGSNDARGSPLVPTNSPPLFACMSESKIFA